MLIYTDQKSHVRYMIIDLTISFYVVDIVHSVPVQQMGNYQEYLKKMPQPLRELETQPVRLHMFGNPFKVNKVWDFYPQNVVYHCVVKTIQYLSSGRRKKYRSEVH